MNAKQNERAAYLAAYAIRNLDTTAIEALACPGARRSAWLNAVAKIIYGTYEAHAHATEHATTFCSAADSTPKSEIMVMPIQRKTQ